MHVLLRNLFYYLLIKLCIKMVLIKISHYYIPINNNINICMYVCMYVMNECDNWNQQNIFIIRMVVPWLIINLCTGLIPSVHARYTALSHQHIRTHRYTHTHTCIRMCACTCCVCMCLNIAYFICILSYWLLSYYFVCISSPFFCT